MQIDDIFDESYKILNYEYIYFCMDIVETCNKYNANK